MAFRMKKDGPLHRKKHKSVVTAAWEHDPHQNHSPQSALSLAILSLLSLQTKVRSVYAWCVCVCVCVCVCLCVCVCVKTELETPKLKNSQIEHIVCLVFQ